MEWSGLASSFFMLFSSFIASSNGDFSTGANQAIRCMLSQSSPRQCSGLPEVSVPSYLVQAYNDGPSSLHEALRSSTLRSLPTDQLISLPISLLYLIPKKRLSELSSSQMGAILQQYADDTSVAQQVAASRKTGQFLLDLMQKLEGAPLPEEVVQILGESISFADVSETFFKSPALPQQPILAYIRPPVLFRLNSDSLNRILLSLKANARHIRKDVLHVIIGAAIENKLPLANIRSLELGLTPDEIRNDSLLKDLSGVNFKLDLSLLQARALFERVYYNVSLHQVQFIDCKPLISKLSPGLLQRFPARENKYSLFEELPSPLTLPTACQITEYVMGDCKLTGKLPKDDSSWETRIRYLGPWVYTLPLSALTDYLDDGLSTAFLQAIESPALSPIQAYYLTGKGQSLNVDDANTVLDLDTVLHALPASQLVTHRLGQISSAVLQYLTANLPADNFPRTLSLVYKIASSIGDMHILEHLLDNKDVNQIMSLVSPKELQASGLRLLDTFSENTEYWPVVQRWPQQVLAALLEMAQQSKKWSWQTLLDKKHINSQLVGGLTCKHVKEMDTGLFIPIMAQYNRQRKQAFPKNLQRCCLLKLIQHLKLKMALTQTESQYGLISLLEPIEIQSVGGYVLVGLPTEAISASPYVNHILSAIGKLSNAELMLAANFSHLQSVAQLAVDKAGNADGFLIGNLSWFVPLNTYIPHLKLMLESGVLDTTICLPATHRQHLAASLVMEFGPPEGWTAGVLATLQDLLMVFTDEELRNISGDSWSDAADSIASHYADDVDWIEPTPFYEVCATLLGAPEATMYRSSLAVLVRWHLIAAQRQLNTVVHLNEINDFKILPIPYLDSLKSHDTISIFDPVVLEHSTEVTSTEEISSTTEEVPLSTTEEKSSSSSTSKSIIDISTSTEKPVTTDKSTTDTVTFNSTNSVLTVKTTTVEPVTSSRTTEKIYINVGDITAINKTSYTIEHSDISLITKNISIPPNISQTAETIKRNLTSLVKQLSENVHLPGISENEGVSNNVTSTPKTINGNQTGLNIGKDEEYEDESDERYKSASILDRSVINPRNKRNINVPEHNIKLTCNALKMVGKRSELALTVNDIVDMDSTEIENCKVELGAMDLSSTIQKEIWRRMRNKAGAHLLGNLLQMVAVADLWDFEFSFTKPWALENIHAMTKNVQKVVLDKLLKEVKDDNSEFPPELVAVLGSNVCSLEAVTLRTVPVVDLEPLGECVPCLPQLAEISVEQLGPVLLWTPHHVHSLNNIVAGLKMEEWKELISSPNQLLGALQPSAVRCLNSAFLEVLGPDHIEMIPTLSLQALSQQQLAALNTTQSWAFGNATEQLMPTVTEKLTPNKKILTAGFGKGASNINSASLLFVIFTCTLQVFNYV